MSDTARQYSSFDQIVAAIRDAASDNPNSTVLVGIDGAGGSGKSTLANKLSDAFGELTVVHLDDFADWSDDSNWVLSTFAERVLKPLMAGITARHQRYDWPTDSLGEWFEIAPSGIAIIEGVSVLRTDLRDYWHVSVWVDCPRDKRLVRGLARDGEAMRSKWEDLWMPGEDAYMQQHLPWDAADFIFDGSGSGESNFSPPV